MHSGDRDTSDTPKLSLNLTDNTNSKKWEINILLCQILESTIHEKKNTKRSCKNNEFKIQAPTWNDKHELRDKSYCVSDIQDFSDFIIKYMK